MPGYGLSPFGVSPFGVGDELEDAAGTGTTAARARAVVSGDYVLTDSGNLEHGDPVDEEVSLRLRTTLGSIAGLPTIGNGVVTLKLASSTAPILVRRFVRQALEPMITRGAITDLKVDQQTFYTGAAVCFYRVHYSKPGLVES